MPFVRDVVSADMPAVNTRYHTLAELHKSNASTLPTSKPWPNTKEFREAGTMTAVNMVIAHLLI